MKRVRDFFEICPDENLNSIGRNSNIKRSNDPIRFSRVNSDFEINTATDNNQSYPQNAYISTESSEMNYEQK